MAPMVSVPETRIVHHTITKTVRVPSDEKASRTRLMLPPASRQ